MENKKTFYLLDHESNRANSIISFPQERTFKIGILLERVNTLFQQLTLSQLSEKLNKEGFGRLPITNGNYSIDNWNQYGVEAEILDPESGGWKKGKVRMRVVLEFCPDEPEKVTINNNSENNSLDDIRKTIS